MHFLSYVFQISRANIVFVPAKVDRLSQRLGPYTLFDFCKYRSKIAKLVFLTQNTVLRPDI